MSTGIFGIDTRTEEGRRAFTEAVDKFNEESARWCDETNAFESYVKTNVAKLAENPIYRGKEFVAIRTNNGYAGFVMDRHAYFGSMFRVLYNRDRALPNNQKTKTRFICKDDRTEAKQMILVK